MRFVNFSFGTDGERHLGVVLDDALVLDLVPALQSVIDVPNDLRDYIAAGPDLHRRVAQTIATTQSWVSPSAREIW